jgi:hypothetical protein
VVYRLGSGRTCANPVLKELPAAADPIQMAHTTGQSAKSVPGAGGTRPPARRKNTIPQAKNRMRRTVAEIVDPGPTNIDPLWEHFEARCAYCGRDLSRSGREGHRDHALPSGGNHLGNLILACGRCNGDEKREQGWREFLVSCLVDSLAVFGKAPG